MTRINGESDGAYRERIRERVRGSSTAGPAAHYRWHAMSVSPAIRDVHVDSPKPGLVRLSVLPADAALADAVRAHINRDDVRVLTDTVTVVAAEEQSETFAIKAINLQNRTIRHHSSNRHELLQTNPQSTLESKQGQISVTQAQ